MQKKIIHFPQENELFDGIASKMEVDYIETDEFKRRFDHEECSDVVLLDIREQEELDGPLGCLDGVCHIPLEQLRLRITEIQDYSNSEVIVICRKANRALVAAQILKHAVFQRVFILEGGMLAYRFL